MLPCVHVLCDVVQPCWYVPTARKRILSASCWVCSHLDVQSLAPVRACQLNTAASPARFLLQWAEQLVHLWSCRYLQRS